MKALKERSHQDGLNFHRITPARVYAESDVQKVRIERTRKMLGDALGGRKGCRIVELGCGVCDISGPFSEKHSVIGVECNQEAIILASKCWPLLSMNTMSLQPEVCDVLVLCEFLEHIADPLELVRSWLPLAKQVIISHPLNGDIKRDLSAGEHQWSFGSVDFRNWFVIGGHSLEAEEVFPMGEYQIILGRGRNLA
jgi:2-polyprenyl-3-methyl-5-hydroxy-6-metoxy-1,4-benzoquinol methylase